MNITKRERIAVDGDTEHIICEDIGLFALFKDHNLEYRHISLTSKVPWKTLIYETISLAFFLLLIKRHIDIEVVEFEEHYFFKLFKTRKRVFVVKSIKPSIRTNDILSDTLLELIEEKEKNGKEVNYLNHIIFRLFDDFLGRRQDYLKPEKDFFLENLKRYVDKFDWLTIEEDFHSFGPMFKYIINIEPIYIPRLKMQHGSVYDVYKAVSKSNLFYKRFNSRLEEVLEYNYDIRRSFNGRSSRRGNWDFPVPNL